MQPTVSIIIPTYKRTQWLQECLDGLAKQTYPMDQFEVIAIDDSSPNASIKETEIKTKTYPFSFTYLIQSKGGPAKARNQGLSVARGKYILFTDDDAVPTKTWIQEMIKTLTQENVSGVSGKTLSYSVNSLTEKYLDHVEHLSKHHFGDEGSLSYIITVNAGFRRTALDEINGFDEKFPFPSGEDMDLGFRLRKANHRLIQNQDAVVLHHQRSTLASMLKTWFIYGRGAYMCAVKNKAVDHQNVTSSELKEFGKVKNTLLAYFRRMKENFSNTNLGKTEAVLFPNFELLNHAAYQLGRIYEHFSLRKKS